MTQKKAEILLAVLIVARSTSFLFSKIGIEDLGIFNLIAVRNILAFMILAIIFHKKILHIKKHTLLGGALLGGVFFLLMTLELNGLKRTAASTTAFLENSAIVFVPLMHAALMRKLPGAVNLLSAGVALLGVFCLTLGGGFGHFGTGEAFGIAAAMSYAAYILLTAHVSTGDDALEIGIVQIGMLGVLGLAASILTESPRLPAGGVEWGCVLSLAIICSAFGLTLQPMAQSHTTPERAGVLCAVSPVSSSIISTVFLKETLGAAGILGAGLILCSIFIPKLVSLPWHRLVPVHAFGHEVRPMRAA